jgi:hypothetical protein
LPSCEQGIGGKRLLRQVRIRGKAAFQDGRHGHPAKLRTAERAWLESYCHTSPGTPSRVVQAAFQERFGIQISLGYLNQVRAHLGLGSRTQEAGEKLDVASSSPTDPQWQEGAGGLLLVAAAEVSGLLSTMETAVARCTPCAASRLAHLSARSRHMLVRTLLFLGVVGLDRTWDLRSYTGDALGVLTGRPRAYGYFHTERFLSQVAQAEGADTFTDGLAQWTARLWKPPVASMQEVEPLYYIDGHRKPVYADALIPRGLIGNSGKILGCRALVLLHDERGHPRLVTTHRGDQHLTVGLPAILAHYEQAAGKAPRTPIIVDREGMAAQFLADLVAAGRTVVTVLRTDQYEGLSSFTEVGAFVPLEHDRHGKLIREVATARFALPLPDQPGGSLPLRVALVRDLRRQVPCIPEEEPARSFDADLNLLKQAWWEDDWQATPLPVAPTTAKLIPIVTTAATADAVTLAQLYARRWPAQENSIRDCAPFRHL